MDNINIKAGIAVVACIALIISAMALHAVHGASNLNVSSLAAVDSLIKERALELAALQQPPYTEPNLGVMGSYLAKIRRDGLPKHAAMKQRMDALAANTTALQTLVDLYEPQATTVQYKAEAKKLRSYAVAWTDRWNSVMEIFMVGGNYPASEVPFPEGFEAAVTAELAAAH
jgi:hypothetical protein